MSKEMFACIRSTGPALHGALIARFVVGTAILVNPVNTACGVILMWLQAVGGHAHVDVSL